MVPNCVAGNDEAIYCGNTGSQSRVTWGASPGTTYYVLVHGFRDAAGNFELQLSAQPVENDTSDTATMVTVEASADDTSPTSIIGSTIGATTDTSVLPTGSCGLTLIDDADSSPGVWYRLQASYVGAVRAVLRAEHSGFDAELIVLSSSNGGVSFDCVNGDAAEVVVTFVALPSRDFFMLVRGRAAADVGDFELQLYQRPSRAGRPPLNNRCQQATALSNSPSQDFPSAHPSFSVNHYVFC